MPDTGSRGQELSSFSFCFLLFDIFAFYDLAVEYFAFFTHFAGLFPLFYGFVLVSYHIQDVAVMVYQFRTFRRVFLQGAFDVDLGQGLIALYEEYP